MEDLVETVNKLQEVFNVSGHSGSIDLPQVVVLGTQSSGKSSVLEHLVGKSFLPRGSGIVTRCPLVLQLSKANDKEYAIFQHNNGKIFTEYPLICEEIQKQTERLAGRNKGICRTPITLKLFSPSFLDLTLIDLPGLTKVPVGDQPEDIDEQTKSLVMQYVENPNSIILAVIPANADMATSESLKISRDVDPEGKRTLAVITKVDIMDKGTNAIDMLSGKVIPVKLGIIGVVNRSQKDINEGKSIEDSLIDEAEFFKKTYKGIALQHGTPYLTRSVQRILINHIRTCLPDLKENVSQQLANQRSELMAMGESKLDQSTLILDLITKFSNNYCSTIKGNIQNVETNEIYGGAKIKDLFQNTLHKSLESVDALDELTENAIVTAVKNASGVSSAIFIPEAAFELLIKQQIKRLRSPCQTCVELVNGELNKISQSCLQDQDLGLSRYPKLQQEISSIFSELLEIRIPGTKEIVNHFIDAQLAYINKAHPDFIPKTLMLTSKRNKNQVTAIEQKLEFHEPIAISDASSSKYNAHSDYILMKELIQSYFSITKKSIEDMVPKMIMHFLVNHIMDHLQTELVKKLYGRGETFADLLEESPEVTRKRVHLKSFITTLEHANKILNSLNSPLTF